MPNMSNINTSRRRFLKQGGAASIASTVSTSWLVNLAGLGSAQAADSQGYKALVCIFLEGGNDACNTILPATEDNDSWIRYDAVRGKLKLARRGTGDLGPFALGRSPDGTTDWHYPIHEKLVKVGAMLRETNSPLALVANVGTLASASTQSNLGTLPARLRSHNDQTNTWHNANSNIAKTGWGGESAELTSLSASSSVANNFRCVVMGNNNAFGIGDNLRAYGMVRQLGSIPLLPQQDAFSKVFGDLPVASVLKAAQGSYRSTFTNLLEKDYAMVVRRAQASAAYAQTLLDATTDISAMTPPLDDKGAPSALALDLQMVAQVIAGHQRAGTTGRQVFYVSLGGFDIHNDPGIHARLLTELDASLAHFRAALVKGDSFGNVVTFTASEFGRLLHANGDGCDHGWGGHHIVMGGPVQGGRIYGAVPRYARNADNTRYTDDHMTGDGALIPSISVGSYAATLCRWFGVQEGEMSDVLNAAIREGEGNLSGLLSA
jgi:uncharacterized protein (DUF1501 family)